MALAKSLDENHMVDLIVTLLHDVYEQYPLTAAPPVTLTGNGQLNSLRGCRSFEHQAVEANYADLNRTIKLVRRRFRAEGVSFLTKTLPTLGRALDFALSHEHPFDCKECRFQPDTPGGKLPKFLGRLFRMVFNEDGELISSPDAQAVRVIRQVSYLFYKYELPYTPDQEREVIAKFVKTEQDLIDHDEMFREIGAELADWPTSVRRHKSYDLIHVVREARCRLQNLLSSFDPLDILPKHGPGAVATRQRLWRKYIWENISERITAKWPLDAYFCASLGHVADDLQSIMAIGTSEEPARVCLVPKDSRGPRLISCEPVDFQWIQGGLNEALVKLVESHPLTRGVVNFTDQDFNRRRALLGSVDGCYATLDLAEASDRISLELVRLLFPPHIYEYLEAARSQATVLPNGEHLKLRKFAPMGSSLCFPILALTIWALVTAALPHCQSSKDLLVYGDDVIVPRTHVRDTIEILEAFGLSINRSKSATSGFFRESCGMDAFYGVDVTPVRLRTVWSSARSPEVYSSWIAYARSFWGLSYKRTYWFIVDNLLSVYGDIPDDNIARNGCVPALPFVPEDRLPRKFRYSSDLQRKEFYMRTIVPVKTEFELPGWSMLLRFFCESRKRSGGWPHSLIGWKPILKRWESARQHWVDFALSETEQLFDLIEDSASFSVRSYTHQRMSKLVRRWR